MYSNQVVVPRVNHPRPFTFMKAFGANDALTILKRQEASRLKAQSF
jgi:hypothetical protein